MGTMIGGPVGTVAGAGVGIAVGMVARGALDAAYDRLPEGTKLAIEDGFEVVGDGAKLVGDGVAAIGCDPRS
ncbi:hypothetical protein Aca07nite_39150 [Actinoplanes capillaceus]|uniref:Glycine zipper n=1 Tax=Actinoplanes campanulatus TaxID=113559 RepID=A0ABQ3WK68_9ACTN|nr:hypothetical protein [Actinoplanes capillaceus]GID46640.1 hypothetical protein Aca07nite_39150 [Actinoplanes capillaceus]